MEDLPDDVLLDIFKRIEMSYVDAVQLCATSSKFRQLCQDYQIVERLAKSQVTKLSPYTTVSGSYEQTYKLILQGQSTWYTIDDQTLQMTPLRTLNQFDVPALAHRFPGLILQPGQYWVVGTREPFWYPWRLLKTRQELMDTVRDLYAKYPVFKDELNAFFAQFNLEEWNFNSNGLEQNLEGGDGDDFTLFVLPVTVRNVQ